MPRETTPYAPLTADTTAEPAPRGAAGKRARTDTIRTGVPIVDDGPLCERLPDRDCFLTPARRRDLISVIWNRAGIVGANARDALQDARIETLLDQPHGWNALAEFVFYSVTGPIIGSIMRGVKIGPHAKYADDIQATLLNVSRAQRKQLQEMASAPVKGKAAKVRFVELVRDTIGPWQQDLSEVVTTTLDDGALIALKDGLDPTILTPGHFKARIDDMLARFTNQRLDEVGVTTIYRHGELVWVGRGRTRRLVVMEDHGVRHAPSTAPDGTKPRELVQKAGRDGAPIVVDADLVEPTVALFRERTGREPRELDIEAAIAMGGALAQLAGDMMINTVAGLGGAL